MESATFDCGGVSLRLELINVNIIYFEVLIFECARPRLTQVNLCV